MNDMSQTIRAADGVAVTDWAKETGERLPSRWIRWAGPILSIIIIAAVANMLGTRDLMSLWRMTPSSWSFWAGVAVFLSIQPVADFIIFRGLWRLPWSGLAALFRKSAANEVLFGYSGELQFYLWAKRHADIPGSPFGAVRDVAVLSAVTGNVVTIVLLLAALAVPGSLDLGPMSGAILWSAIVLVGSSLAVMLFRRRLLSVDRSQFWRIGAIHLARSIAVTVMVGLLWAMVMPGMAVGWWLMLAAARQFITRLPFLPNKDMVFAGIAAGMLHDVPHIGETVALVAGVIIVGQVTIGAVLTLFDLTREAMEMEGR